MNSRAGAGKTQLEPVVHQALALEPRANAKRIQQVDGALLEQAGALALLDVVAAARFQHDAVDRYYYWNDIRHAFAQVGITG